MIKRHMLSAILGGCLLFSALLLSGCAETEVKEPITPSIINEPIPFGEQVELFVDEYLIDTLDNVSFELTAPESVGEVLSFDKDWEGLGSLVLTAVQDEDNIKLYYRAYPSSNKTDEQMLCIAVSEDGIHFEREAINKITYNGIKENNILRMDSFCHNFAPFLDTNPNCKPDEKYKAIGGKKEDGGVFLFASPDGYNWHSLSKKAAITEGRFDSMNMAFYNPITGLYSAYTRYYHTKLPLGSEIRANCPSGARAIQSSTSSDFLTWTVPVQNQYEEGIIDQLYTNAVRPIPGAEHILASFPMRYMQGRNDEDNAARKGVSDAVFMTSRDGVNWDRTVNDPWLAGGLASHEWTARNFITAGGIVENGLYFYMYTTKNYYWDDGGIWAYRLPRYRFMSLHSDLEGGSILTKSLEFNSNKLYLNFSTSAYGSIQVFVLDEEGNEFFASDELYGNQISYRLNIPGLKGTTGRILIKLKDAHVYAIGSDMLAH